MNNKNSSMYIKKKNNKTGVWFGIGKFSSKNY